MARSISLWAGMFGAALVFAGVAFGAPRVASCGTHGLVVSGVQVVGLHAQGVSCSKARTVAGTIAHDLAQGRAVSVNGARGFAMNEESCTGCKTTTSVSVQYARGQITVAIRGGSVSMGGSAPIVAAFPGVPSGSGTVV